MGVQDPKDLKVKLGPVVKYIAYGVFLFAALTVLKVACEQVPKPPTPPIM